ncbi:aldehyde dehydrogenase [Aspergillus ellipticus CBS 707.79]|uniref:Beta-apo-4'-carotenal oxygenase n=1 Tax=Aspergillus ellipticus CBS 707.79 TaxID=1448320 RepID=A0A319D4U8_9EURO|nr:aldehyde dehydrogenase [Aspergillus ellipticus CBS 707.79]
MAFLKNLQMKRQALTWNMVMAYVIIGISVTSYGFDDSVFSAMQSMDCKYAFSAQHLAYLNSLGLPVKLVCIIGVLTSYTVTSFGQVLAGRMIVQCFVGCPAVVRGAAIAVYVFSHFFGAFLSAIATYETAKIDGNMAWKIPTAIMWTFPCLSLIFCWLVPESPRWLIRKNKVEKASKQLEYLYKGQDVDINGEIAFLQKSIEADAQTKGSWAELFQGTNKRRTLIAIMAALPSQLAGQNFVSKYGNLFIKSLGVMNNFTFMLIYRGISVIATLVTFGLVDTAGRRPIYLVGDTISTGLLLACGGLGIGAITDGKKRGVYGVLIMYGLFNIMSFWSIGMITIAETAHLRLRDQTSVVAWIFCIICDFATTYTLPYLLDAPYANLQSKVGFIYGAFAALLVILGYFFLPELTGRSLEELEETWQKRIPARKFSATAYESVQAAFASGRTKSKEWRRHQLKRAWWMVEDNKDRIFAALHADLNKHPYESSLAEITMVQKDILHTLDNLDNWTKDEKPTRRDPINFFGGTVVRKEPLGVALIIASWNVAITLALQPMVAAIASGCAVIVKPSDLSQACQDLLMEIIPEYLDQDAIRCVSAGPHEMKYILEHRFDHIFYTGSPNTAKIIYAAAAKYLTPVTLELGGQGPAIIMPSANIDLAAKRIAATKFALAGQVCVNVNHILVHPSVRGALVTSLIKYFDEFIGGKGNKADYYCHIVNERNFDRLESLLQKTSGKIVYDGIRNRDTRYFGPTIVVDVKPDDSLLSEELFGPILPIIDADFDTAISFTRSLECPLALYAFTNEESEKRRVRNETLSGGVTFNDCMVHAAALDAPFGGVGNSGIGRYHGQHGILTFSHLRAYSDGFPEWMERFMGARYPPYTIETTNKLAPPVKAPFDRDGNDKTSGGKVVGYAATLGAVAASLWILGGNEWIPGYAMAWLGK